MEEYVFTFGADQLNAGKCVRIKGNYGEARNKMFELFGTQWAFQYPAEQWDAWKRDPHRAWFLEREVDLKDLEIDKQVNIWEVMRREQDNE